MKLDFRLELENYGNIGSREHPTGLVLWKDPAVFHGRTRIKRGAVGTDRKTLRELMRLSNMATHEG